MSSLICSSIGKKLFVSLTGLFLMSFLLIHLTINLLLIFDDSGELFNQGAHFMATNPFIKIVEPVLAVGFILHMIYGAVVTVKNWMARPVKYARVSNSNSSKWASRNMWILGGLIFTFLVIHIINFYWKIKVTHEVGSVAGTDMHDTYTLVAGLFKSCITVNIIYIIGAVLLGLHLEHGFWSAFQTIGWSNDIWRKRITMVGRIYALIIAAGFAIIPLYFIIKF